ncbi:MAG: TIGR02679 family protein [Sciscionella sp.]
MSEPDRLHRLLGGPELAWLIARVRKRLERDEPLEGTVTLSSATQPQRDAVYRLLGRRPRAGAALSVPLPAVDKVLRESGVCPAGLATAVTALTGPIPSRAALAREQKLLWDSAFQPLDDLAGRRSALADWVRGLRESGLLRRLAPDPVAARELTRTLARVVGALPAEPVSLAEFAARTAGGAHALDDDRPLATLTLGAARALTGMPAGSGAQWRRELWSAVGVARDELSSTVLTLGLPGDADTPTGRALRGCYGEPVVLTLRQLMRLPPHIAVPQVFACENPAIVSAAADKLGPHCAPLVCTQGQPGTAVIRLLRSLADAGARIRYHGDFDWGGIHIGNVVFARVPAQPWHFSATDYSACAHLGQPLTGRQVTASWDPHLAGAMARHGLAVEEEQVMSPLLADLARSPKAAHCH